MRPYKIPGILLQKEFQLIMTRLGKKIYSFYRIGMKNYNTYQLLGNTDEISAAMTSLSLTHRFVLFLMPNLSPLTPFGMGV